MCQLTRTTTIVAAILAPSLARPASLRSDEQSRRPATRRAFSRIRFRCRRLLVRLARPHGVHPRIIRRERQLTNPGIDRIHERCRRRSEMTQAQCVPIFM